MLKRNSYYGLFCSCESDGIHTESTAFGDGTIEIQLSCDDIKVECIYRPNVPLIDKNGKNVFFTAGLIKNKKYSIILTTSDPYLSLIDCLGSVNARQVFQRFIKLSNIV